jgi:hypothetical protein
MKKMKVNVIMPMLGGGTRMRGIQSTCKPLMKLPDGNLFFLKALKSLKNYNVQALILVVLKDYFKDFDDVLSEAGRVSGATSVHLIPHEPTSSPVETLRIGFNRLLTSYDVNLPTFVLDCDVYGAIPAFDPMDFEAGRVFYFADKNPNKSYIRTKGVNDDVVAEIVEKRVISDKAVMGAYLFEDIRLLRKLLEYTSYPFGYISGLIQYAIESENATIGASPAANVTNFGTIEELEQYGK